MNKLTQSTSTKTKAHTQDLIHTMDTAHEVPKWPLCYDNKEAVTHHYPEYATLKDL